jgi:lambda family phage portal protein
MVKPRIRQMGELRVGAAATDAMRGGQAFNASSLSHPDLRNWTPWPGSPDSDLLPELPVIRARSRDLARNHGVAGGALQTQLDNVLGCGLWLAPTPDYVLLGKSREWATEWRRNVKALWRNWSESTWCDAGKSLTLDGLAMQVFSGTWLNGDGLALPLWLPEPLAPSATRIQIIESDRLSNPNYAPDTATRRGGVEINDFGAPTGYWIRKSHPGDTYFYTFGANLTWDLIPAETGWGRRRVIHAHDKGRAGQSRGIPALAATMQEFKVLKDYRGAELKASVVNAMVGLVVESAMSQDGLMELLSSDSDALKMYTDGLAGRKRSALDFAGGGMILPVALGDKVHGFTPARPSTAYEPFTTTAFRHIATGLNMPYELLLKDFSKTNYSSARAALLEAWRFFTGRREWLARSFYQPVYELFMEEMVDRGLIEAPDFYAKKTAWCRARWVGPGRGWIDPLKEAQASELRMDIFISTLEDECAEQGKDWEEVLEQRAEENKKMKELGLERVVPKTLEPKGATDEIDTPAQAPVPA